MSDNFLPTIYQQFIHKSRYARWLEDKGRRESWPETVERLSTFLRKRFDGKDVSFDEIENAILNLEVMPSMRLLMTAGQAVEKSNISAFNCSYLAINHPRAFDEALYILMNGTGLGFSVERQDINQLPEVPELHETDTTIVVGDSKLGWAVAFKQLISFLYAGEIAKWDLSKLRPAGARLKTFGGRSSGPRPLDDLFKFTVNTFKKAQGRKLTSLECHDIMCKIGEVVVVGGVRRSALISLSNLSDQRMRDAKSGEWWVANPQRALANNSAVYTEKPDVGQFMEEWLALYNSKSGERGIFNREAAKKKALESEREAREFGTNPCFSGDTPILTSNGYFEIETLVGQKIEVWNGEEWSEVEPYSTGLNSTKIIYFSDGSKLRCTPYHKFLICDEKGQEVRVKAENLEIGDKLMKYDMPVIENGIEYCQQPYSQGFYSGDGNTGLEFSWIYGPKTNCIENLNGSIGKFDEKNNRYRWTHGPMLDKSFVPINGSLSYRLQWLAGILDSDGTVTNDKHGSGFQLSSINKDFLLKIRLMLTTMGVRAKVVKEKDGHYKDMPGGNYYCQPSYRLLIENYDAAHLVKLGLPILRLHHDGQMPQRDARQFVRVIDIQEDEICETFCFTEPKKNRGTFNGIVAGNCGEILLRSNEFCNLTEVVIRENDNENTLKEKVRIATILGTLQSALTDFPYLRKVWKNNCDEERLLGVSLTGIMDNPLLNDVNVQTKVLLSDLRKYAKEVNKEYAERIGINPSVSITCVKPSGTVSALVDTASGIHSRHSPYYIRRVRNDIKDPLTQFMIDAGISWEKDVMNDQNIVFSFPMKSPDKSISRNDRTAISELELWKMYRQYWCDHNPSVTISVREHEWPSVGAWVWNNFDDICGVSFLPYSEHIYAQAPYEECNRETYEALKEKMPTSIDWNALIEVEDDTVSSQELACVSGVCMI